MTNNFETVRCIGPVSWPLALIAVMISSGCGSDDPLSYSAPVGISLSASSGDVAQGQVVATKNINTESGNPYAAFIADSRAALGDADPHRLEVVGLTLTLESSSTNVATLGEAFLGAVDIDFVMNTTDTRIPVGRLTAGATTGVGPLDLVTSFDASGLAVADFDSLIGGSFKVELTGTVTPAFEAGNATADMQATFTFASYDE